MEKLMWRRAASKAFSTAGGMVGARADKAFAWCDEVLGGWAVGKGARDYELESMEVVVIGDGVALMVVVGSAPYLGRDGE